MVEQKIQTNWNELFKVNLSTIYEESMDKHDLIKTLIVRKLLRKYNKIKNKIRIYTEFVINDNRVSDIYFEDWKNKNAYVFEIQKEVTNSWIENIQKDYKDFSVPFMNTFDLIIIPLRECPDKISEINNWLDKFI